MIHADSADDENPYPLVQTLEKVHPLGAHHIAASADGRIAASAGFGGEVKVWECEEDGQWGLKGEVKVEGKKAGEHWALALNESGQYLASTTHDGRVNVYDTTTISPVAAAPTSKVAQFETKGSFGLSLDLSPDGTMTASGHQNGAIYIFSNSTSRLLHSLSGLLKPIRAVKFSPANKYLAATGDSRIIGLYDTNSGEQIASLTGHQSWIMSLDWNWSGEFFATAGYDGRVRVWSFERRECVATQTEGEGKCVWAVRWLPKAASARNETFVVAGAGRGLSFYREASGT